MNYKHLYTAFLCVLFYFVSSAQAPTANFTSDVTSGCAPLVVKFEDISTGNPTSWYWDFGNGATSTLQEPSATYFGEGTFAVKLVVTNANGSDSITKTAYINIVNPPQVNFTANKRAGCGPTTIQFTDQSANATGTTNTEWLWDFGDGTTSTERNPVKIFSTPDNYSITLRVTNDKGCSKIVTKANYINITESAIADFRYRQPARCGLPVTINFTNYSTGPQNLSYQWNFGDGNTSTDANPSHNYTATGKFTVQLITNSSLGCADTIQKEITVGQYTTDFTVPVVCQSTDIQLLNASTPKPVSSRWVFPDGSVSTGLNVTKSFPASGPVSIKLINNYGACSDSVTKTVNVVARPTVAFATLDTVDCKVPSTVNFTNTSNGTSYQWSFGDGNTSTQASPSHTYTQFGDYTITLIATDANGCTDSLKKENLVRIQKPVISFPELPKRGCIPYTQQFRADIISVDKITGYQWNFGDGSTSTEINPSHTYTTRGTYNVTLTVTTESGCTETYTLASAITVGTKPVADFSADKNDICASDRVQFTDLSTPANEITEWAWTFSDGSTSSQKNPLQQFRDTGFINVQLVAYNNGCPSDPVRKTNYVHVKPPIAQFTFRPNCNKRTEISFTNNSVVDPSLPTTWLWNFGDGRTSSQQNPGPHTYSRIGSWRVTLTVTNGACTSTYQQTVRIANATPDFTASSLTGCKPFNTTFKATSGVSIVNSLWNFGDGTTANASGATQSHTYTESGNYNVRVTITDQYGCQESRTKNLYIKVYGPTAEFVSPVNQGCKGFTARFEDQSTSDGEHPITSWKWSFGDNKEQTFTSGPFEHKYDTSGFFDVVLEVKDSYGCTDTVQKTGLVTVSSLKANWTSLTQTCPDAVVQFDNQTTGENFNSVWEFGDGTTSTDQSPSYAYSDTGFYSIKLRVSDNIGCKDSLVRTNHIQVGQPVASFTENNLTSFCIPFQAKFQNTSTYYEEHFWDLDIATTRREHPSIYYTNAGTYNIKLIVTSPGGCKDTLEKQVRVFNPADARITYGPDLTGCKPVTVNFEAFAEMNARFVWDFGDGNVIDTTSNKMVHTYKDFGNFTPRLIMTEPSGTCRVAIIGRQPIRVLGAKAKFGIDQTLFCDSGYVRISDSTTFNDPITSYVWNFGDGTVSTNPNDTIHRYERPGNYDVFLTITTRNGCVDSLRSMPIKVVQSPLISIESEREVCTNESMRHAGVFERTDTSAVRWLWQFPNGNAASAQYPANQLYTTPGEYVVTAYATNSSGCADTATQNIVVHPIPEVTVPSALTMQAGFPVTIPATYGASVINYVWDPSATLSCRECPQPVASPKFNTKYTVTVTDNNGCRNTGEVNVVVICKNANVYIPNTFSPNGDGSNDAFYVRGKGLDRVKSLRIFNRWGEVVFEKKDFPVNDASASWNGSFKGNRPQADVYIYQVEVYCENGEIIRFEGNVALIL